MIRRTITFSILVAALVAPVLSYAQSADARQRLQTMFPIPRPPRVPAPPGDFWVWVPPTYRTVYDRVWQPPGVQTVTETVWVPDRYGWRTVCYWEGGQYVQRQEWGVVSPAHWETRTRQVHTPGQWVMVPRQELISGGHWEWRGPTPAPPAPTPTPQPRTPAPRPSGLEPFSPLWEWPDEKP
jgi:hypothetical protein